MTARVNRFLSVTAVLLSCAVVFGEESPDKWFRDGRAAVEAAKRLKPVEGRAKNVILFIGDGMGVATVTAARILEGQLRGESGEENLLSFEKLPYVALIKTYNTDQQTPDSAGTMSAIVTGVKTKAGFISVNQNVTRGDHTNVAGNSPTTILELAERKGLSTGVVSTTRITHATPACCYAHSPERGWESDTALGSAARHADFPDIARQLIEFPIGDGLEVALGGGRSNFIPSEATDPEDGGAKGARRDGRDLTKEWTRRPDAAYVWNKKQFDAVDAAKTSHLLGLFERSHMEYEYDRHSDTGGEPSLSEMVAKAIDLLKRNPKGFFLMVEGGRIDHAHHGANAFRALRETVEFANAVTAAVQRTSPKETLIIVTADHSHVFTMGGYPKRGNPILGKVVGIAGAGKWAEVYAKDALGLPYTTLAYANGPGYTGASVQQAEGPKKRPHYGPLYKGVTKGRPDLADVDTEDDRYLQECGVPMASETHGGEDVPLHAGGPGAHLFHGVMEQNVICHVMAAALGLDAVK